MTDALSPDEIDQLLAAINGSDDDNTECFIRKNKSTVGLNAGLQKIVDTLACGGYEVFGIHQKGFVGAKPERPAYTVRVAKAVPKQGRETE